MPIPVSKTTKTTLLSGLHVWKGPFDFAVSRSLNISVGNSHRFQAKDLLMSSRILETIR